MMCGPGEGSRPREKIKASKASRPGPTVHLEAGLPLLGLRPGLLGSWPRPRPRPFGPKIKAKRNGP